MNPLQHFSLAMLLLVIGLVSAQSGLEVPYMPGFYFGIGLLVVDFILWWTLFGRKLQ